MEMAINARKRKKVKKNHKIAQKLNLMIQLYIRYLKNVENAWVILSLQSMMLMKL